MSERDKFAPVIEGFDCSGITDPYSYRCEPFYVDGENAGTLLDGSTVHDVLASKIRLSWNLTVLTPERYAALNAALEGAEVLDTVSAYVYDATCDAVRLASFHVTRPSCRAVNNFGATHIIPQSALVLEEASPIARFRVTPPEKLSYSIGEALDLSGLAVTAYDKDGAASDITAQCAVTPENGSALLNPGAVLLSVSYDGFPVYAAAVTVAEGEIIDGGDWWTLYATGLLEIYCIGDMPDFSPSEDGRPPWTRSSVKSVIIKDSVTSIGNYAFHYHKSLTSVIIGNSVTGIGYEAFYGCSALSNVTIGNSVTSIGSSAFHSCSALTSATIPDSVTRIGSYAFYGCSALSNVTIGDSVTGIEYRAFSRCSALTSVTIPDSVTKIEYSTFEYTALTSVTINRNCTVGPNAFPSGCVINYYD